jgi:hypothetical protein
MLNRQSLGFVQSTKTFKGWRSLECLFGGFCLPVLVVVGNYYLHMVLQFVSCIEYFPMQIIISYLSLLLSATALWCSSIICRLALSSNLSVLILLSRLSNFSSDFCSLGPRSQKSVTFYPVYFLILFIYLFISTFAALAHVLESQ